MVVIWAGFTYIAGREITLKDVANTEDNFNAAVVAALNATSNKSILLPSVGYNQFSPNIVWCWANSFPLYYTRFDRLINILLTR